MKITKNIDSTIFREYDVRGIVNKGLTEDVAYTIGRAFASYMNNQNKTSVIVGHDNRNSYELLYPALIKGLTDSGANVIDLGFVTTPMTNFAKIFLNIECAIMLTASHNPKEYNGFKLSLEKEDSLYGYDLKLFKDFLDKYEFIDKKGSVFEFDIKEDYMDKLKEKISLGERKIKAVVDVGNGTGALFIKDILDMFNIEYELLYAESDSNFPNHTPDPAVKANMIDLAKKVKELNYDVGLAVDGDCDRVGVVLEDGKYINADLVMLIFYRYISETMKTKKATFDVKCSKTLLDELDKLGIEKLMNRTGGVYCRKKIKEMNLDFGGEYSGHLIFNDKYYGYDDGIYALLRFVEVLSHTNKKASELLEGINEYYSIDETKIEVTEENKFEIVSKIEEYVKGKNYNYINIDGIRTIFDDGFALVRASNTGPHLTVRFEADTKERLREITDEFIFLINKIRRNESDTTQQS